MVKKYTPNRGDIVTINFNPQSGREQAGKRPALIISPKSYNAKTGLALACPITSKVKNYPFETKLPKQIKTKGVVLSDHVKNLDWQTRRVKFIEKLPNSQTEEVIYKLSILLD